VVQELVSGTPEYIRRLMLEEHGSRKCARILFFFDRKALVEILYELPDETILILAREMARLRGSLTDLQRAREEVEGELRRVTEVIDLDPPSPPGAEGFVFLDRAEPEELIELARDLDDYQLAAVVCNAPVESATFLLGSIDRKRWRLDLIEEMTRMRIRGGDQALELAQVTREALEAVDPDLNCLRGSPSSGSDSFAQRTADSEENLTQLVSVWDKHELPRLLSGFPVDHLAPALASGDARLEALFRDNMSQRCWQDILQERERLGEVEPQMAEAARMAVLNRLRHLRDGGEGAGA
jgi:hypothetical protein